MVRLLLLRLSLAALACSAFTAASAGASVLYVGDSLGVGTAPQLSTRLGGTRLEVDAVNGRPSFAGVDVLDSLIGPEHDVVVFDLGTNDDPGAPATLAADLARARELSGDRCLVIATLNRPPLNGVSIDGLNRAVTSFAARDTNVALVDWRAAVAQDRGLLVDGVHPDAEGYVVRAGLFADAIASCSAFGGGSTPSTPLEPESAAGLPPAASAGRNTGGAGHPPDSDKPRRGGGDTRVEALATAIAPAVATGTDFG